LIEIKSAYKANYPISYTCNQIPRLFLENAQVTWVKYTDLVRFIHWSEIFVALTGRDIRISNQLLNTRALHFTQPQAYYQASVTITLGRRV